MLVFGRIYRFLAGKRLFCCMIGLVVVFPVLRPILLASLPTLVLLGLPVSCCVDIVVAVLLRVGFSSGPSLAFHFLSSSFLFFFLLCIFSRRLGIGAIYRIIPDVCGVHGCRI